jgi:Mg/Co/Ni transporter MgtE
MVLQRYESMLSRHVIITVFLTMLVGAGGNAGNQSAIKVIEGIAIGAVAYTCPLFGSTQALCMG